MLLTTFGRVERASGELGTWGWPAQEQEDSGIDNKAQGQQRNQGQGWVDSWKEGKRLRAGADGTEQNGWMEMGQNPRGGGGMETEGWKEKGWGGEQKSVLLRAALLGAGRTPC